MLNKHIKHIKGAKKSVAARYLQLKSGHVGTGVHLLRINKVQARVIGGEVAADRRLSITCWNAGSGEDNMLHKLNTKGLPSVKRNRLP
jgi:hypothetical protein